jgi:proteasome lid subunit RPN8/RPN11
MQHLTDQPQFMSHPPMPPIVVERLVKVAQADRPDEICGFIMRGWEIYPITNVADNTSDDFNMDGKELIRAWTECEDDIIGIYHSHPCGTESPSDTDATYAPKDIRYWIVAGTNVIEWDMSGAEPIRI